MRARFPCKCAVFARERDELAPLWYIYIYIHEYVGIYICVYIYIYIYIYIYKVGDEVAKEGVGVH